MPLAQRGLAVQHGDMAAGGHRGAPWARMVELALLATLAGLLFALYANGYLDRIFSDVLTTWFFFIILSIVVVVEAFAFSGREVDVSFWGWLTTGLGMLGTVLGFSMALAGIDIEALQNPTALTAEIGGFLKMVAFAVDTTLIGLAAALVMAAMDKVREILHQRPRTRRGGDAES